MDMLKLIKQAGIQAVEQSAPATVMFGVVKQVNPLVITVEQHLDIPAEFLLLTDNVRDHWVDMTVDHFTENDAYLDTTHSHSKQEPFAGEDSFDSTHKHAYKGRKPFLVHYGLKVGEQVVLVRVQGGQKFVVWNRVVKA